MNRIKTLETLSFQQKNIYESPSLRFEESYVYF